METKYKIKTPSPDYNLAFFYHYTFPKQLSPPKKLFTIYEKSINKSYIYTNNDFSYKNISFILTNISLIYTFLRGGRK